MHQFAAMTSLLCFIEADVYCSKFKLSYVNYERSPGVYRIICMKYIFFRISIYSFDTYIFTYYKTVEILDIACNFV